MRITDRVRSNRNKFARIELGDDPDEQYQRQQELQFWKNTVKVMALPVSKELII